jgi:hypothetical protein
MSFSKFLTGRVGIISSSSDYNGNDSSVPILIDPANGSIKCNNIIGNVNASVNLDSINANINTLFLTTNAQGNHIGNLNTSTLTLFTTTNSQSNTLDDHNDYFNDINVAILGLDGAVEQAQNDIINLQSNVNVLVNTDVNLQNSINLIVNTSSNQQNQINGLILTDMSIQNSINLLVNTDVNLQNSINNLVNTDVNLQNSINLLVNTDVNLQNSINLLVNTDVNLQNSINNLVNTDANLQSQINNISGLTFQTFYANLGTDVLQTKINQLAGATRKQLIISPGSWTPTGAITFNNLDTVAIIGTTTFSPLTRITPSSGGFTISGASSTRNSFQYLSFNDTFTINGTQGRHRFYKCDFLQGLTISGTTTNFLEFESCEFTGGALTIPITFGGVVFFKNCNFTGTTAFNLDNPLASQVIFLANIGVNPVNTNKCTIQSWNEINGLTQADASIVNCNDLNSTANINGFSGTFTDGTTTILIDPVTTKGIEIQNALGQAKIKLVDNDGDEIEIQNTEIDIFHSASLNQTNRYYQFKDANGNEVDWYIGGTTPTHVASKGSIFVETSTPSIYQSNGGGVWNTVGGGGGSSVVGSYNVPVIARATMSAGQTITSNTKVLFDTMSFVEPVGWISNISSNTFTIPFSGVYTIVSSINGTVGSNIPFAMTVVRNGSIINSRENEFTNAGDFGLSIFYIDYFSAGDLVQINAQAIGGSIVISNATSFFSIQGFRQDPLTISSTIYIPKIVKRIMSGTNVINTTPSQIFYLNPEIKLPNSTWINDSVNGEFTINENGVYQVNAGYQLPSPAGDYFSTIFIYKNGVEIQRDTEFINSSTTTPVVSIVGYYSLIVGDVIQIWAQNSLIGQAVQNQPASYFMVQKITV